MTLSAGMRLGHYEILSPLGAGGMGEVFRARDTALGREVAVKVLPAHLRENPEALSRFEREARAVAALSHPNILAIHEFGLQGTTAYAVTELLDGETLRERLAAGALPLRKAVEYAAQIARGLAAAHAKGIVHRDLKPENVFVTGDGRVKVLDFGLARQSTPGGTPDTRSPTVSRPTDAGTILGTVGYMSPEQVRGKALDHRSDLFSLGCVLYEMLTGRRAFHRETAAETMTAILKEDPPEIAESGVVTAPAVDRLVRHCLEKRPEERFQSAQDIAFDLEAALEPSGRGAPPEATGPHAGVGRARRAGAAVALGALAAGIAAGAWYGRRHAADPHEVEPSFTRLTFGQGTIWAARFTPDGRTVVYSAAWEGQPIRLYHTRTESAEATPLTLPDAHLLSVSPAGELAVSLGHRFEGWMGRGTLARSPLLGGGARPVLEDVREGEWAPDGSQLAVVRRVAGREVLEYPAGKVLYETVGYVSHVRFSPRGDRIAFADHPLFADNIGSVAVVDLAGRKTDLTSSWTGGIGGLAWSPSGDEVWFTAARGSDDKSLRAVDMSARERLVLGGLTDMTLFDVSPDGRALLGRDTGVRHVEALVPGSPRPREFSLARQNSISRNISANPKALAITDQSGKRYEVFLRPFDGSLPVHLGEGDTFGLSPDGRWSLALTPESRPRILLHPTGPGQTRELPNAEGVDYLGMKWLPSGRIVAFGAVGKGRIKGHLLDPETGTQRPFTQEGVEPVRYWSIPVSPDGARVVARDSEGRVNAYPVDGGPPVPIDGLSPLDVPLEWSSDGRALFVARPGETPWKIRRFDLESGRDTPWTEVMAVNPGGIRLSQLYITPDGRYWVHSYARLLTDLFIAEGLR